MDEPLSYAPSQKQIVPRVTNEILIKHLVESFGTGVEGLICDVHTVIACSLPKRTRSDQCKYLAELFARAIDSPKTGEIIELNRVMELKTEYCREYPQFMMKYDQPTRDSYHILDRLFRNAKEHFFSYRPSNVRPKTLPINSRTSRITANDNEFRNWLKSHGHQLPEGPGKIITMKFLQGSFFRDSSIIVNDDLIFFLLFIIEQVVPSFNLIFPRDGLIITNGNGAGKEENQLNGPEGVFVDDDQTMFIVDTKNARVMEWKTRDVKGKVVAGSGTAGRGLHQLNHPTNVWVDKETNSLIICDWGNQRIVQWSRADGTTEGKILLENIAGSGLFMDDQRNIYITDTNKKEVRRYQIEGDPKGTLVAGGGGNGIASDQFRWPTFIFVDQQQTVYVCDSTANRIMKWEKDAKEGEVVAGDCGRGPGLNQLSYPQGIVVDKSGNIYIADRYNNRVMRWAKGAKEGTIVLGARYPRQRGPLREPRGLCFDRHGNIYVADYANNRVQGFSIEQTHIDA